MSGIALYVAATLALSTPPPANGGAAWKTLEAALDKVAMFTVANQEGKPLQYKIDGKAVALFYSDIAAAKTELAQAQEQYPELGCDLIPVGLGGVYQLSCDNAAVLVPGTRDLEAAGMPAGMSAMGQPLPLFACMEMSREGSDGSPVLPLFVSHADCVAAVEQATVADLGEADEKLEIVGLSLPSVVERLGNMDSESTAFVFIASRASTDYISAYLNEQAS